MTEITFSQKKTDSFHQQIFLAFKGKARKVQHLEHSFYKENPTRCNGVSKFIIPYLYESQTCFGRHAAHHQEPKTALAASGFSYVEGCWPCR
jgi:hypothetical protein